MEKMIKVDRCWCGSKDLDIFSEQYYRCNGCNTLVCAFRMPEEFYQIADNTKGFYGKDYWTKYVKEELGFQDITDRSRNDMAERCIYWLRAILKYKLPPATTLELGCAHGGLVFMLKLAGYNSTGTEMSRWVCEYAKEAFNVPMMCGRIEDLAISPKTYDMIILMDVLEHMTDPVGSIRKIADTLKDDGLLVIQTPCWRETGSTYQEMKENQSLFMRMLQEKEHLYLFNENSLKHLLTEAGLLYTSFETPFFPYDMFIFGGKQPLSQIDKETIATALLKTPDGRIILALMDVFEKLLESETDRMARFEQIQELTALARTAQAENMGLEQLPEVRLRRKLSDIYKKIFGKEALE